MPHPRSVPAIAALFALAGCIDGVDAPTDAGRVAIDVAPLNLSGITNAEYTVTVRNGSGEVVWTKSADADGYGDGGGSLSLVGPCDADDPANTVTLVLDALYDAAGEVPAGTFANPTPVTRSATCVADADTPVDFELVLTRRAEQGFFDIGVSFQDIFCSAKLDCENAGADLNLLAKADGTRDMTAVLGLACTGGVSGPTYLYLDDPVITCTGLATPITVDPTGRGNVDLAAAPSQNDDGYLFAASVFRGVEQLADKAYWNISFGLDEALFASAGTCTLTTRATASKEPFPQTESGFPVPEGTVYPVIDWDVTLSTAAGRACTEHPVNGTPTGVATSYVGYLAAPNAFTFGATPIYLQHRYEPATDTVLSAAPPAVPQVEANLLTPWDGVTSDSTTGGDAWRVADRSPTDGAEWGEHCVQTSGSGAHWLRVDFGEATTVHAFGVEGYPGGSHMPTGTWELQGSDDASSWVTVWSGTGGWEAGTPAQYPPRTTLTLPAPATYRYFRVYSDSWTNGYMLMCNLALYGMIDPPAAPPAEGPVEVDIANGQGGFYIDSVTWGDADNPLDRYPSPTTANAASYCVQSDSTNYHAYGVDLLEPRRVHAFGIQGYDASHLPSAPWHLQISEDGVGWMTVWTGDPSLWGIGFGSATYPPRTIITLDTPVVARHWRVQADSWTNGYMIVCNLALYGTQPAAGTEVVTTSDTVTISDLQWGNPQNVARHDPDKSTADYTNDCVQTNGSGAHWLAVDLGEPHVVTTFGVVGWPSSGAGSHRPSALWSLEGSNDGSSWTPVWTGAGNWQADAGLPTYPPRWTIPVTTPGSYQHYRIYATSWTNGYLLVCNWSLFE